MSGELFGTLCSSVLSIIGLLGEERHVRLHEILYFVQSYMTFFPPPLIGFRNNVSDFSKRNRFCLRRSRRKHLCRNSVLVIPSIWFVYLYKQTVSITVVVMGTKQFNNKTTHRQQVKTGFVQKWENRSPGLFKDCSRTFSFFKDSCLILYAIL